MPVRTTGVVGNKYLYRQNLERARTVASRLSCIPENASDPHFFNRTLSRLREGLYNLVDAETDFLRSYRILSHAENMTVSRRHELRFGTVIPLPKFL